MIRVAVTDGDPLEVVGRVADTLRTSQIAVRDLGLRRPTLDDVFLQLTGELAATPPHDADDEVQEVVA